MVERQVTPMPSRSNPGIQPTRTPAPTPEEQKTIFRSISGCTVKPAVLSLVPPLNQQYTCKEIDNWYPSPCPTALFFKRRVFAVRLHRVVAAVSTSIA